MESVEARPQLEQKLGKPQEAGPTFQESKMPSLEINGRLRDATTCDELKSHSAKERNPLKNNLLRLLES